MLMKAQQGRRVGVSSETTEDRGPIPQRCFLEPFMLNRPLKQVSSNESSLAGRRGGVHIQDKDPETVMPRIPGIRHKNEQCTP